MTKIISVVNQKGGVGKTTSSVNIATALASLSLRVLLVDLDPQGNASTGLGVTQEERKNDIYDVMMDSVTVEKSIIRTNIPGLFLIPATVNLSACETELSLFKNREFILRNKLQTICANYDYIIIDCPPSLGILTINALTFCDDLLVPLQCEFFALEGLAHLLKTISIIQKNLNPGLKILGIVLTMYDRRNRITEAVEADVRSCLGDLVFKTIIPRNSKLSEAPSHGVPALIYDYKCSGSMAYVYLVKEILAKYKNEN